MNPPPRPLASKDLQPEGRSAISPPAPEFSTRKFEAALQVARQLTRLQQHLPKTQKDWENRAPLLNSSSTIRNQCRHDRHLRKILLTACQVLDGISWFRQVNRVTLGL